MSGRLSLTYKTRLTNMLFMPRADKAVCFEMVETESKQIHPYVSWQHNMDEFMETSFKDVENIPDREREHMVALLTLFVLDNGEQLDFEWFQALARMQNLSDSKSVSDIIKGLLDEVAISASAVRDFKNVTLSMLPTHRGETGRLSGGVASMMRTELLKGKWVLAVVSDTNDLYKVAFFRVLNDTAVQSFIAQVEQALSMVTGMTCSNMWNLFDTLQRPAVGRVDDGLAGLWREPNNCWSWLKVNSMGLETAMNDLEEGKQDTSDNLLMPLVLEAIAHDRPVKQAWEGILEAAVQETPDA